jgi:NAD(P)-dependent dehydrogenase (short-subunit alcohol dehydrogenase family)
LRTSALADRNANPVYLIIPIGQGDIACPQPAIILSLKQFPAKYLSGESTIANSSQTTPPQTATPPLTGRHAFITGASRGIGAAIARELGRLGAKLSLIGRDDEALQAQVEAVAAASGAKVRKFLLDVTDAAQIAPTVERAAAELGPIDILVNNAGAATSAPFGRTTLEQWRAMLEVNLTGPFLLTQAVLPGMAARKFGRVINVASTAGLKGYGYVAPYCAAKHGVIGLTRSLAIEYARSGVTINAVCPGYTETDIAARAVETMVEKTGRTERQAYEELAALNPQRRLVQPEEVAQSVGWLALATSSSINGQAIAVAGGEIMS